MHPRPSLLSPRFRTIALGLLVAMGAGIALRCARLEVRPMHNDEAVNAIKFCRLWEQGTYKYDPNEHHGPILYYATVALARLNRAPDFEHFTENQLQVLTLVFGLWMILPLPMRAV